MPVGADIRSPRWNLPKEPAVPVGIAVDPLRLTVGGGAERPLSIARRHLRSEHLLDGLARGELAIEQCLVPSKEVVNRGVQRARRIGNGHVHVVRFHPGLLVSRCVLSERWEVLVVTGVAQMKHLKDLLLEKLRIGLTRYVFHDGSKNRVAGTAVAEFGSIMENVSGESYAQFQIGRAHV